MDNVADQTFEGKRGLLARLKDRLARTRQGFSENISALFLGAKVIDETLLEAIETLLIQSDFGMPVTLEIMASLNQQVQRRDLSDPEAVKQALRKHLIGLLSAAARPLTLQEDQTQVILMVGVNGAGKTTTAGKLAHYYKAQNRSVMLAAGDTFRAAAVEQLKAWGLRNEIEVIAQHTGADSASVIFDGLAAAKSRKVDVLIADTAGRLQNKKNLMQELEKIVRVVRRQDENALKNVLLVIDATTGQNAIVQAKSFLESVAVTGIVLTKLDGTAKGGVVFALTEALGLPIHFVGVGEQLDDLKPFDPELFVSAILDEADHAHV
ncbi:MAG: signal recognition particle-docking protein FtsY [Pseudomonadales bacterium]